MPEDLIHPGESPTLPGQAGRKALMFCSDLNRDSWAHLCPLDFEAIYKAFVRVPIYAVFLSVFLGLIFLPI